MLSFSTLIWILSNYQTLLQFSKKEVQNLNTVFVKFTQVLFIIYPSFLKIFSRIFKISPNFFWIFLQFFFQNFNKYYSKLILFLNLRCISTTLSQSFIDILSIFLQISQIFFSKIYAVSIKLQLKFAQNFILVYLKNFLQVFKVFLNFFWRSNYFSHKINCQ